MRVNDDYKEWNAARQTKAENSVHAFWKRALTFRKRHDVLVSHDGCCSLRLDNGCW